jgi:putative endonuclease
MPAYVYILASQRNGTLYTGSTVSLMRRAWEHQESVDPGFTSRYGVKRLVWFEVHSSRHDAFLRERQIKKWNRLWKLELIERLNPGWRDLAEDFQPE